MAGLVFAVTALAPNPASAQPQADAVRDDQAGILECPYIPPTADPQVLRTVYLVGLELGADSRVMLAGFEAGWVESRMNNLPCGDRDSLGVFQQRPSQGWGTPEQIMNVDFASRSFFVRAIANAAAYPGWSAGQVAQSVQRSCCPLRYDQAQATALALIAQAQAMIPPDYSTAGVSSVIHGGVLRVFVRGANGSLWQAFWYNSQWVWQDLGGQILDRPSAVVHNGVLRVFARSATGSLWQYFWTGEQWGGQDLGGILTSGPSAIDDRGTLRVFFRSATHSLWQHFWTGQQWVGQDLGGVLASGPSAVIHDGLLRVFLRSQTQSLWQHIWTGQQWVGQDLGGIIASSPAAISDNGVLRVFAISANGTLWQYFWTGQQWAGQDLGGIVTSGPAAVTHDGILRVFFRSATHSLWQHFWTGQQWVGQDLGGVLA